MRRAASLLVTQGAQALEGTLFSSSCRAGLGPSTSQPSLPAGLRCAEGSQCHDAAWHALCCGLCSPAPPPCQGTGSLPARPCASGPFCSLMLMGLALLPRTHCTRALVPAGTFKALLESQSMRRGKPSSMGGWPALPAWSLHSHPAHLRHMLQLLMVCVPLFSQAMSLYCTTSAHAGTMQGASTSTTCRWHGLICDSCMRPGPFPWLSIHASRWHGLIP